MKILQVKRLYLPALSIVAVVILLLILISISTYRNLDRDQKKALNFAHRQGITLLRALEAGARAAALPGYHRQAIGRLIREVGKNEDVAYIYLMDTHQRILHRSWTQPPIAPLPDAPVPEMDGTEVTRLRRNSDNQLVYELAKRFFPFAEGQGISQPGAAGAGPGGGLTTLPPIDEILVLGLNMGVYEAARGADLHHAMVMAAILLVLGTGTFFFIFVIQNYYLVDQTLKQTQDYTRQVVASMANGLLSIDIAGRIVSYNLLALELLGLAESEVRGMDLKTLLDFQRCGIDEILQQGRAVLDREIIYRRRTGESVPLAMSITPICDDREPCQGAVLILRDLREIRELEEKVRRSERLAAVGKLAAGVAHEIRNPLSSIRGFARFLQHALADRPQDQEYAAIMVREVDRINGVVTDLLTLSRSWEGKPTPCRPGDLVEHTARLVAADARSKGVTLASAVAPDLPSIAVDGSQITQALLNLMLNALHAVDSRGTITSGAGLTPDGRWLELWVEDDGPGISDAHRPKIFDPFFTTREKGIGLGLSIVHKIVENHGGEIRLQSPLAGREAGCRFTLRFPRRPSAAEGGVA
ncbi:MAG: ATP-binding protein [Desulfobacterales bacterium]|nr:ATP-binding protein [Desulfobacterales bacterium]